MDHVVYLDYKAGELDNLKSGEKTMIIRGATGRRTPYGLVNISDVLYFIENKGNGLIKGKAIVTDVFNSGKLSEEESLAIIEQNKEKLLLDSRLMKRFGGKRYLVLISIKDFQEVKPFKISRSGYANMDDWLPVEKIGKVKIAWH